jgi:aspartate/methionine/tyrosine aminotransferase
MGEPGFPPPDGVVEYATAKLAKTRGVVPYSPPKGLLSIRRGIAHWRKTYHGQEVDHDAILVTIGGAGASFVTLQTLARRAPEVWIPTVTYPIYNSFGQDPTLRNVRRYDPSAEGLLQCERDGMPGSVVVIVNPLNPHGAVLSGTQVEEAVASMKEKDCKVVLDLSFEDIVYDGPREAYRTSMDRQQSLAAVSIHSFSKTFSMAGWRVGYAIINDPALRRDAMLSQWRSFLSPPLISQWAVECALAAHYPDYIVPILRELRDRRDEAMRTLPEGMVASKPEAGYFLWLRATTDFAIRLAEECKVLTVDGGVFGEEGIGYLRVNLAAPEESLSIGLERIAELYKKVMR